MSCNNAAARFERVVIVGVDPIMPAMFDDYVVVDVYSPARVPAGEVVKEPFEVGELRSVDSNITVQPDIVIAKSPEATSVFTSVAYLI
jgi:hypothetical protein